MARKRPIEDPPPTSSSEEEKGQEESSKGNSSAEDDDESQNDAFNEDDEEESEDEQKTPLKKQNTDFGKVGSDSESASDKSIPSPNVSDFTIKPIVMKPNKSAPKSTPKSKQIATESSSKQKKPSASNGGDGNAKTPGTSRLWSEADEIAILEGMIEYKSKKGSDPNADSNGFHDFIKQSIQVDVTKNQLTDKIRRLKKKYKINAEKGQHGNIPVLPKPHDHKSFELSKKIWGNETNDKNNKSQKKMKTLGSEDKDKTEINGEVTLGLPCSLKDKEVNAGVSTEVCYGSEEDKVGFWKDYPCMKESFDTGRWGHAGGFLKELVEKKDGEIGRDKLSEMERVWRKLRREELELYLKRLELVQEVAQAALNVIKGFEI